MSDQKQEGRRRAAGAPVGRTAPGAAPPAGTATPGPQSPICKTGTANGELQRGGSRGLRLFSQGNPTGPGAGPARPPPALQVRPIFGSSPRSRRRMLAAWRIQIMTASKPATSAI